MKKETKKLRSGYTTGVHTSHAFQSALDGSLSSKKLCISKTIKVDNDDLDVTKGCEIVVCISPLFEDLEINQIAHNPYIITSKKAQCFIYAGIGVGVVTKDGLKPPKNYPAINPVPLQILSDIFSKKVTGSQKFYCSVSVTDGEIIAKQTANAKVGVLGGISILGTKGIVKPISADAYIDSIKEELNFAYTNHFKTIYFTLGNSSYKKAKEQENGAYIIEIGNFVYDGILLAVEKKFPNIFLWIGVAKAVKIAQGYKNTHNRFGGIDFKEVGSWIEMDLTGFSTIKGVRESLGDKREIFDKNIIQRTEQQLESWMNRKIKVIQC